jgi:hypothetical protein
MAIQQVPLRLEVSIISAEHRLNRHAIMISLLTLDLFASTLSGAWIRHRSCDRFGGRIGIAQSMSSGRTQVIIYKSKASQHLIDNPSSLVSFISEAQSGQRAKDKERSSQLGFIEQSQNSMSINGQHRFRSRRVEIL